jgi:hypothetical protein
VADYQPLAAKQRLKWFARSTFGPASLAGSVVSAAFGTALNRPEEYGTHWEGFGDRLGMGVSGNSVSNAMEAGLGSLWGEDPRYFRASGESFGHRVGHIVKGTFIAYNADGHTMPAYARYMAISGSNFLSNTWRERSEADASHASSRIVFGFLGRMAGNAFAEFWPDLTRKAFHHGSAAIPQRG